jgi:hypothetical protein
MFYIFSHPLKKAENGFFFLRCKTGQGLRKKKPFSAFFSG